MDWKDKNSWNGYIMTFIVGFDGEEIVKKVRCHSVIRGYKVMDIIYDLKGIPFYNDGLEPWPVKGRKLKVWNDKIGKCELVDFSKGKQLTLF